MIDHFFKYLNLEFTFESDLSNSFHGPCCAFEKYYFFKLHCEAWNINPNSISRIRYIVICSPPLSQFDVIIQLSGLWIKGPIWRNVLHANHRFQPHSTGGTMSSIFSFEQPKCEKSFKGCQHFERNSSIKRPLKKGIQVEKFQKMLD